MIPAAYISSEEEQEGREIGRGRIALVRLRTMVKNKVRAIIGKENLNYSGSDLFGKRGIAWLQSQELSAGKKEVILIYLKVIDHLNILIKELEEVIKERGSRML